MTQKAVLVTGASGMLGTEFVRVLSKHYKVYALWNRCQVTVESANVTPIKVDLTDKDAVHAALEGVQCDEIVHCAALINLGVCEQDFEQALRVNVLATKNLIDILSLYSGQARFIYISSDAVYPDCRGDKPESMPTQPSTAYGFTKKWSEDLVNSRWSSKSIVLRTTIVGPAPNQFFMWVLDKARRAEEIPLFDDVAFSPISTRDFVLKTHKMIQNEDIEGIYNLGGDQSITKSDFGQLILKAIESKCPIKLTSVKSMQSGVARSLNMSLDSTKVSKVIGKLPSPAETVEQVLVGSKT